jgi:hypothetical protein
MYQTTTKKQDGKIKELETKIDNLTEYIMSLPNQSNNNINRKMSYADAVIGHQTINTNLNGQRTKQRHTIKPNTDIQPITKSQRRFILTRNFNETTFAPAPVTIRKTINQVLIQAKAPLSHQVVSVDMNSKGNLVILTNEKCMAKAILKYSKQIEDAIKTKDPEVNQIRSSNSWAKVVIHGIDLSMFTDNENGMTDLKNEIEKYNPKTNFIKIPRYMTHPDKRI